MPTYKLLSKERHPDYDEPYWKRIRALYSGNRLKEKILKDKDLRKDIFPRHNAEEENVYLERIHRSHYIPYLPQIIDSIVASLSSDPCQMYRGDELSEEAEQKADDTEDVSKKDGEDFYDHFYTDVSPPGCTKMSLNQLLRNQVLTALQLKRAWTLIDLPKPNEFDLPPASLADQESMGLLRAYAVPVDPESVIDWECDDYGELLWALTYSQKKSRPNLEVTRKRIREEWCYYTRDDWTKYAIEYDPEVDPPQPDDDIPLVESGSHSFKRVPLIPFCLPDGLWAGGKIESLVVEHFNKRNALSWGEYKSLFQFLVAKLAPPDPLNVVTEDAQRAINQKVGSGRIMVLGDKDSLEYCGPDSMPFEVAMKDLESLRDEMFRVLHHMAFSVENSGVALKRSGDSKRMDQVQTIIILKALGQITREHAADIYEMVGMGRGDALANWKADGFDNFKALTLDTLVADMVALENLSIPSDEYQIRRKLRFAIADLGDGVPDEVVATIEEQLRENIVKETVQKEEMKKVELDTSKKALAAPIAAPGGFNGSSKSGTST